MNENREVMLEIKNLKQYFRLSKNKIVKAVDDVSFKVYKGETFGLVGESGSGKTTIGRSVIKLYNITGGEVYFKGERISAPVKSIYKEYKMYKSGKTPETLELANKIKALKSELKLANKEKSDSQKAENIKQEIEKLKGQIKQIINSPEHKKVVDDLKEAYLSAYNDNKVKPHFRRSMQMIFQDPMASLNPRMPVIDIIAEGLDIHKLYKTKEERDEKVYKLLNIVGLDKEHANRYPHEFSGGQRQRIGIARALITNPEFIVCDEPISALDVSIQAQVVNLLSRLKREFGLTYLFIAHDLSMVHYISDRIGVMHLGRLVELGSSDAINNNPIHPYTKSLLSAVPIPDPDFQKTRKRIAYNKKEVDYYKGKWVEVEKDHFVLGTEEEIAKWTAKN